MLRDTPPSTARAPDASKRAPPPLATVLLAHGAGAPMDSPFLNAMAGRVAGHGIEVVRFEFAYMAERRLGGSRRPPPKAERLCGEYHHAVDAVAARGPLIIGGKSMGGRVASLVAQELFAQRRIAGLVCLGYPFHPPRKPASVRTAHLAALACPSLFVQGENDALGSRADVTGYDLSSKIRLHWIAGADHDLAPKAQAGVTRAMLREIAWTQAAVAVAQFAARAGRI